MRSVWRTNVDGDVVCHVINRCKALKIIGDRVVDLHGARFADVHAQHAIRPATANILSQLSGAAVIESRAIDERAVLRQAKQTGTWIARLWFAGCGPNFDEAKTQRCQSLRRGSVLIKAGSQSHRVREFKSESLQLAKGLTLKSSFGQAPS